jgi:hypothetical protein
MLLFEYGWPLLTQKKLALRVMATSNYTLKKKKKMSTENSKLEGPLCNSKKR